VALSYMLLRFINNPIVNKSNKITSLRHALNYMGEVEVKKFIALLALANLADGKSPELVQMSLVRAKFCELVAHARKDKDNPPTGFLVGLFSLLDALLDQDMENLVAKLPLSDDLKYALCGRESSLKQYLALAIALERANWSKVKRIAAELKLNQRILHSFYNESLKWGMAMAQSNSRGS
jgi:EAL and modified HD-GYP domain-containing signal transduction protein